MALIGNRHTKGAKTCTIFTLAVTVAATVTDWAIAIEKVEICLNSIGFGIFLVAHTHTDITHAISMAKRHYICVVCSM